MFINALLMSNYTVITYTKFFFFTIIDNAKQVN